MGRPDAGPPPTMRPSPPRAAATAGRVELPPLRRKDAVRDRDAPHLKPPATGTGSLVPPSARRNGHRTGATAEVPHRNEDAADTATGSAGVKPSPGIR